MKTNREPFRWGRQIPVAFWMSWVVTLVLDIAGAGVGWLQSRANRSPVSEAIMPGLHRHLDLTGFYRRIGDYGTAAFFSQDIKNDLFNYPALMAVPLHWLFAANTPLQRYNACLSIWLILLVVISVRALSLAGVPAVAGLALTTLVLATNFPANLLFFTYNLEVFVWAVVTLGICSYVLGYQWLAATCFGIGTALKYYPVVLLGLFPFRRAWPKIVCGLVTAFLANLLGLKLMGPTMSQAQKGLQASTKVFSDYYLSRLRPIDSTYDHSLFNVIKSLLVYIAQRPVPWLLPWYIVTVVPLLVLLYFKRIQFLPVPQRLLSLSVIAVWVMPISQDYTLVLLLAPMLVLLLRALRNTDTISRPLWLALLCLGVVFGALTFLTVGSTGLGGYVRAVLLAVILSCSLRRDFYVLSSDLYLPQTG